MSPSIVARRFALWLTICAVSAAPSFALALSAKADPVGMIAAVVLFAICYTLVTCTRRFEQLHRRPFVRSTLYVGYGLRILLSLLTGAAIVGGSRVVSYASVPDLFCGIASLRIVSLATGGSSVNEARVETLAGAFVTTCVQGAILNVVVFILMAIAYGLQRATRKPPADGLRGFDVVPIASPEQFTSAPAAETHPARPRVE